MDVDGAEGVRRGSHFSAQLPSVAFGFLPARDRIVDRPGRSVRRSKLPLVFPDSAAELIFYCQVAMFCGTLKIGKQAQIVNVHTVQTL